MPAAADPVTSGLLSRIRVVHALPLVPLFMVALFASATIRDNSFLWHVRAGEVQRTAGSVLSHDVFSFTELGSEWRTQSWLVELLYDSIDGVAPSLAWMNWIVLIVGGITMLMVGIAVYRSTPSLVMVSLTLIVSAWLLGPFLQPRPVLFSFLLLASLVVVLQNPDRLLWLVVPIIWIWAGVHGSWVIGGGLVVLEWLRTGDKRLVAVGTIALVATLTTPHGLGTWLIVVDFFGARDALSLMQEWKPPDFFSAAQMPYLVLVLGIVVAFWRSKIGVRDFVVVLPFLLFGLTSRRAVTPAAIVLLPYAVLALPLLRVPRSNTKPAVAAAIVATVGAATMLPMISSSVGTLDPKRFPDDEVRAAISGRNVFHDDAVGGYLIYAEFPERLVWIDDRAELHGIERLQEFTDARDGEYETVFDRYGFDSALTRPDWPLTDELIGDGWRTTYQSENFLVLVPPLGR